MAHGLNMQVNHTQPLISCKLVGPTCFLLAILRASTGPQLYSLVGQPQVLTGGVWREEMKRSGEVMWEGAWLSFRHSASGGYLSQSGGARLPFFQGRVPQTSTPQHRRLSGGDNSCAEPHHLPHLATHAMISGPKLRVRVEWRGIGDGSLLGWSSQSLSSKGLLGNGPNSSRVFHVVFCSGCWEGGLTVSQHMGTLGSAPSCIPSKTICWTELTSHGPMGIKVSTNMMAVSKNTCRPCRCQNAIWASPTRVLSSLLVPPISQSAKGTGTDSPSQYIQSGVSQAGSPFGWYSKGSQTKTNYFGDHYFGRLSIMAVCFFEGTLFEGASLGKAMGHPPSLLRTPPPRTPPLPVCHSEGFRRAMPSGQRVLGDYISRPRAPKGCFLNKCPRFQPREFLQFASFAFDFFWGLEQLRWLKKKLDFTGGAHGTVKGSLSMPFLLPETQGARGVCMIAVQLSCFGTRKNRSPGHAHLHQGSQSVESQVKGNSPCFQAQWVCIKHSFLSDLCGVTGPLSLVALFCCPFHWAVDPKTGQLLSTWHSGLDLWFLGW